MFNVERTIISQYGPTSTLATLCRNIDTYLNPAADIDMFYDFVWNVDTAEGFGLDTWGRIVDVSRTLNVPADTPNPGMYPFTPGAFELDDEQYRIVVLTKALANITNCTAESLNQLLSNLFADRGRCYVLDTGNMTMQWTFEFYLEPFEYVIMSEGGVAPIPAGVLATIVQVDVPTTFGFDEAVQMQPFDQGVFYQPDLPMVLHAIVTGVDGTEYNVTNIVQGPDGAPYFVSPIVTGVDGTPYTIFS